MASKDPRVTWQQALQRLSTRPNRAALHAVIDLARRETLAPLDLADLVRISAQSGLRLPPSSEHAAAFSSTGGPGSLTTLLAPLFLGASGFLVPTLGVPGRPAGCVDVLAAIPGYRLGLTEDEAKDVLAHSRLLHLRADELWAPLDTHLFKLRQEIGAQAVPDLAIASLLAKKVAVGVSFAGLDVRVAPHGNFGPDFNTALANSRRFIEVAKALDIEAVCLLTDAQHPQQPHIGRGEALRALLAVCLGETDTWLAQHAQLAWRFARSVAGLVDVPTDEFERPTPTALQNTLEANLRAQSASLSALRAAIHEADGHDTRNVCVEAGGFLHIDLAHLRDCLVRRQRSDRHPDPCGVTLFARTGAEVAPGQAVARIRARLHINPLAAEVSRAFAALDDPPAGTQAPRLLTVDGPTELTGII